MLTKDQELHLQYIKSSFVAAVDVKYKKGVEEHGGNLWLKRKLIDEALNEIIDLYVYLITLRDQIELKEYDKI